MCVVSMKTTRPRVAASGVVLALLAVVTFGLSGHQDALRAQAAAVGGDDARRVAYLQELGYETEPKWTQVREIALPKEFDEAFSDYNELQLQAGFDLSPYRGRRVKCWTYTVLNYPGFEGVQAHLYEYNNRIVGGDISSALAEGFRHGLTPLSLEQAEQITEGDQNGETG